MPDCPVVFLAFANEKESAARYLRGLAVEQDALRKALEPAVAAGLCELVVESNARVDTILDTFQKARYRDRIAVFHYGGHADGYQLLLESLDGSNVIAHGGGLVSFFSRQRGLKLIFLNGCSTQQQALDLTTAGVPAVVGTARSINDTIATDLASRFYSSLGQGNAIERAWAEATDEVMITGGDAPNRAFHWADEEDNTVLTDHLPWDIYYAKGAGAVREWNLPRAARNPLFGLELPESYYRRLPAVPFVGLHYFTREAAALFFGRGAQIRELYNQITGTTPIILLYGKSGVGKSSLLDAGLVPRLENKYDVVYIRRNQEAGLTGSLLQGLDQLLPMDSGGDPTSGGTDERRAVRRLLEEAAERAGRQPLQQEIARLIDRLQDQGVGAWSGLTDVLKKWHTVESRNERPLIVILDQVEERYTRPMPGATGDELAELLDAIRPLFTAAAGSVRGKLILSYRKEYHPEIRDTFRTQALPYSELFLKRLDREGIVEAVTGINQHPETRRKYRLEVEASETGNLAEIIADDLLEDPGSSIAPVLQIILGKLWRTATEQDGDDPARFTVAAYQALKKEGVTMGEFFAQQLAKLRTEHPAYVRSGLALDLLQAHTTDLGTAGSCRQDDLLARYDLAEASIATLLQSLQDLSLLNRLDAETTILAHDTLAPVVIREYNLSDAPGQRAARILQNKVSDVGFMLDPAYRAKLVAADVPGAADPQLAKAHLGPDKYRAALRAALGEAYWERDADRLLAQTVYDFRSGRTGISLNDADLEAVEAGAGLAPEVVPGMRRLLPVERQLVELSRQRRARQRRQRRQLRFAAAVAVLLIGAASIWAWSEKQNAEASARAAEASARASEALYLTSKAREALAAGDATMAFSIAAMAWERTPVNEAVNVLTELMGQEPMLYAGRDELPFTAPSTLAVSPNDSNLLVVQRDFPNQIMLYSRDWSQHWALGSTGEEYLDFEVPAVFSSSGRFCAVGLRDSVRIYDVREKRLFRSFAVAHQVRQLSFASDEEYILARSGAQPEVAYDTLSVLNLAGTEMEMLKIAAPCDVIFDGSAEVPGLLFFDGTNLNRRPIRTGGTPSGADNTDIPILSSVPVKYKFNADGRYLLLDSTASIYVYENDGGVLKKVNYFPLSIGDRQLTLSPDGRFLLLSASAGNDFMCINLQTGAQRTWSLPDGECLWVNGVFLNQSPPTLLITTTCGNPMRGGDMFSNPEPKIFRYDLRWVGHGHDLSEKSCADFVFDLEERAACLREQIPGLADTTDRYTLVAAASGVKTLIQNSQGQVVQDLSVYESPETEVLQTYLTNDPPFVIAMTLDVSGNRPDDELLVRPIWTYPWEQGWVYRLTEAETSAYLSVAKPDE